jgi:hypothetical protein
MDYSQMPVYKPRRIPRAFEKICYSKALVLLLLASALPLEQGLVNC